MRQVYNTVLTGDLTYEVTEVSRASTSLPGSVFETRVTIDSSLN
jgi:hypothetical protein